MRQKLIKVISVLLVATILYANSAAVVSYAADNFLSAKEIENQGTSTNNKNVDFDVYYDGGKHSAIADINSTNTKLNVAINVKNAGYLKDAVVDFSNSNFTIAKADENAEASEKLEVVEEENKIKFNQINNGENVISSINILASKPDEVSTDIFSKDNIAKFSATYVDEKAEEVAISKDIVIHTEWEAQNAKAKLNYEITKYIPYVSEDFNKLITQGKVTSYVENSVLPIKETQIELIAPKIDNTYPESVIVTANTTAATNGDMIGQSFTKDNWTYDNGTGKVSIINVKNDVKDGKITWTKNSVDEYLVTYIYSEDVLVEAVKESAIRVTYEAKSNISLYGNGSGVTGVNASVDGYEDIDKRLGRVVDFEAEATANIFKGYIYNNVYAADDDKKETEYSVKYMVNIPYVDIVDSLELQLGVDKFITTQGEEKNTVSGEDKYTYNKTLKISKQELLKIFGEEAQINIVDADGVILQTINKDITDENGNIVVDLSKFNNNDIKIQTSRPIVEGNVNFEVTKAVAKDIKYSEEELKELAILRTSVVGIAKRGTTEVVNSEKTDNVILREPTQKAEIAINNDRLSTITQNRDVEIKVILENDSIDDIMYKNPTIKVDLPANIEQLELVKEPEIFFDSHLRVVEIEIVDNEDGTKSIVATLEGIQTKYNNVAAKGATIVFTTNITLNRLTPTTNTAINLTVTNDDEEKTITTNEAQVKYIAPTGVVTINTMTGYNGSEVLEAINGEAKQVTIQTKAEQKELTFNMNVINNYENTLDNVVVLGRTPFAGNKDVVSSQDLGSTLTLPMVSAVTVNGIDEENITVYYSENGEATQDLAKTSNGWTTSIDDYSKVKSYMIVLNNYTMNTGASFTFNYKATLPANLDYDQVAYENYAVYFNNNQTSGTIADKTVATKIGVTTGNIAKLEATLIAKAGDGASVPSGSNLEYELTINNKGTLDAENVVIELEQPSEITYLPEENEDSKTEYIYKKETDENGELIETTELEKIVTTINLGTIKANSSITKKLTFGTNATSQEERTVQIKAKVKYGENAEIETNTVSNVLTKVYFKTQIVSPEDETYQEGEEYSYRVKVTSSEKSYAMPEGEAEKAIRKNTTITVTLPEELKYESIELTDYSDGSYEGKDVTSSATVAVNGNIVTVNIGDVDGSLGKKLVVNTKVGALPDGVYQKDVTIKSTIQADNTGVEQIDDVIEHLNKAGIVATQTCNIPDGATISAGENFTYTFTLENLSDIDLSDVKLVDYLPQGVQIKTLEVVYADGTTDRSNQKNDDGSIEAKIHLAPKAKVTVNVNVVAKSLSEDTRITNNAKVSQELVPEFETNSIAHTIKRFDKGDINIKPGDDKQTKKIIGTIWVDANKDGIKDAREEKVSGVKVLLLNNATGDIAIDSTGNSCITNTGKDGAYMFNNVKQGKYTVIFLYDSSNYSPTVYRKEGVSSSQNSDAIDTTVVYEDKTQIAGVTEEIVVADENIFDIDLGIIEDAKFDLSLDKVVESITVNNSKNTTEHNYNGKLAKIDFEAKYAESSSMVVKYKFTIKNEGGIAGYVKKLADYLPKELKFNSELNPDWYEGKDGVIYNNSLANVLINPGETKEVTLLLIKNMNSEDFGLINNSAEIYETSNDYGALDVDSTPANKVEKEDDYSTADVLTTVKTGEAMMYTTLTLTVIAIIGIGIYIIKKKVLK